MIQFTCLKDTVDALRKMDGGGTRVEMRRLEISAIW